jgi:hypothetical protein
MQHSNIQHANIQHIDIRHNDSKVTLKPTAFSIMTFSIRIRKYGITLTTLSTQCCYTESH